MPNIVKIPGILTIKKVPACESGSFRRMALLFARSDVDGAIATSGYCSASTIFVNPMEWDAFTRTASPDFKI